MVSFGRVRGCSESNDAVPHCKTLCHIAMTLCHIAMTLCHIAMTLCHTCNDAVPHCKTASSQRRPVHRAQRVEGACRAGTPSKGFVRVLLACAQLWMRMPGWAATGQQKLSAVTAHRAVAVLGPKVALLVISLAFPQHVSPVLSQLLSSSPGRVAAYACTCLHISAASASTHK